MFNILLNIYYSFFYNFIIKNFYTPLYEIEGKERVFRRKNKVVVLLDNEDLGKQIFETLSSLIKNSLKIKTKYYSISFNKVYSNSENCVKFYFLKLNEVSLPESKLEKLQFLTNFIEELQNKGYLLDKQKFESFSHDSITDLINLFTINNKGETSSNDFIVKYIHKVLSDGLDFDSFYKNIVENNTFCKVSDFPYGINVIGMCFDLYVKNITPNSIFEVLREEEADINYGTDHYRDLILVSEENLKNTAKSSKEDEDSWIYDSDIIIYKSVSETFADFIRNTDSEKFKILNEEVVEHITDIIISPHGDIIGIKIISTEIKNPREILKCDKHSQKKIIDFISKLNEFLDRIYILSEYNVVGKKAFRIEEDLLFTDNREIEFKINSIEDLFNFLTDDLYETKIQVSQVFLKIYKDFITIKYDNLTSRDELLSKPEIRYLSPIMATELINYILGQEVDFNVFKSELLKFINSDKPETSKGNLVYYSDFKFDPTLVPFLFDSEVQSKYGIKFGESKCIQLSDGRLLVTFSNPITVEQLIYDRDTRMEFIKDKFDDFDNACVKILGINSVVYSSDHFTKSKNKEMYDVIGVITDKAPGDQLTDDFISRQSNKFLYLLGAYILSYFNTYYIDLSNIWMDNKFIFYINIFNESYSVGTMYSEHYSSWFKKHLREIKFNPYALMCMQNIKSRKQLINHAISLGAYCNIHNVFYNEINDMCPICEKTTCIVSKHKWFTINHMQNQVVYEDDLAKHYIYNNFYFLKVYKKTGTDLKNLERNLFNIIYNDYNIEQVRFKPFKIAYDSSNNVIGYIYKIFNFNNLINISDLTKMENLPRIKLCIRLILQVKELLDSGYGFTSNPFGTVFLDKTIKRQVQILNPEFIAEDADKDYTIKWTIDFIHEIIASDPNIEMSKNKLRNDLNGLLKQLQSMSSDLTQHCNIHQIYFSKKRFFCPLCAKKFDGDSMNVEYLSRDKFSNISNENEGGEALIYPLDNGLIAKIFKNNSINYTMKCSVLCRIFTKNSDLERINNENHKFKFVIPKFVLVDPESNELYGYAMERVNSGMPISSLRDKKEVKKLGFTRQDVLEILITAGEGISTLHNFGIYIGDLNGRNILFDKMKNIYFLDFDGMGIDEFSPLFCTDGYIDPISKKNQNITMKDDWYSFAIQAFYYLTYTHPFNGIYFWHDNWDIPTKMENKISLLGNHNMKPPVVAESWDWMGPELIQKFRNIFEGNDRSDITQALMNQYEILYGNNKVKLSSIFVARKYFLFGDCYTCFNQFSTVKTTDNGYEISLLINSGVNSNKIDLNIETEDAILDIILSESGNIVFVFCSSHVYVSKAKENSNIFEVEIQDASTAFVSGETLYFASQSRGGEAFYQVDLVENQIKTSKLRFLPELQTRKFFVRNGSKYVTVKKISKNEDCVYCNTEEMFRIENNDENLIYQVLFDNYTKKWLVLNSEGFGATIDENNGSVFKFDVSSSVSKNNINNIVYQKGVIYIPNERELDVVTFGENGIVIKKMECSDLMSPKTRIFNVSAKGFSIISDGCLYEVGKE